MRLQIVLCALLFLLTPLFAAPSVLKVENGGLLFTDNQAGVSGTDAGYSVPLGNQTLWMFGDVFLLDPTVPIKPYLRMISNCGLWVPSGSGIEPLRHYKFFTEPQSGIARPLLTPLPTEANEKNLRLWPYGGWYNDAEKCAYLFYARVVTTGTGPFDFRTEGHGLASADTTNLDALQFTRLSAAPNQMLWWSAQDNAALYGSAVVSNAPGDYLYIVGWQERDGKKRGKLARVAKSRITDLKAYEYFTGTDGKVSWNREANAATDIPGLDDFPTELSVAYNQYLGGYLAVHSVGVSDKVRLSLAPNPWGPYQNIAEISAPHRAFSRAFCYAGKEHPELAQEQGRIIYVTYVDSERYWLQMLKVTLQRG
jgi:hypothetical protein